MKIKNLVIWLFICGCFIFAGCKSNQYEKLMNEAAEYAWFNDMDDAEKSLEVLEKAIKLEPHIWDAYAQEIEIYASWEHKSRDFSKNQNAVKKVYERWLENENTFDYLQKFGYANTLYGLGEYNKAEKIYDELFETYNLRSSEIKGTHLEFLYLFCGVMTDKISEENIDSFLQDDNLRTYFLEEIYSMQQFGKEDSATRYCNLNRIIKN